MTIWMDNDMPNFDLEDAHDGLVFGLDEVGRGPLAGPVVAACVCIPDDLRALPFVADITDSKKLSEKKLEALYSAITEHFVWAVAGLSPAEIDEINILQASLRAMEMAFSAMPSLRKQGSYYEAQGPRFREDAILCLVDGNKLPNLPCSARAVVKGDSKSVSIAAASIVAKVTRDRMMRKLHEEYPQYGWNTNVGYPSRAHRDGIELHGITAHHRKSFAPVRNYLNKINSNALAS